MLNFVKNMKSITVIPVTTRVKLLDGSTFGHIVGVRIGINNIVSYEVMYFTSLEEQYKTELLSDFQFTVVSKKRMNVGFDYTDKN